MTALAPLPVRSTMAWRRLDVAGHESACIESVAAGWRLTGAVEVAEAGVTARLRYRIDADDAWRTRSVRVDGAANGTPVCVDLTSDGRGQWTLGGQAAPAVSGALDVDLGFSPLTNTLPIRRLGLTVGASADVRAAWIRFPEFRLEALHQSYTREAPQIFRYRATVDGGAFTARLETDRVGRVLHYEGLWKAVEVDGA